IVYGISYRPGEYVFVTLARIIHQISQLIAASPDNEQYVIFSKSNNIIDLTSCYFVDSLGSLQGAASIPQTLYKTPVELPIFDF
ncbi:MAG: hypothetical protein R3281_00930, partial [Balneolaceae bacterium]|nr:hypothetical protein [Balneolaceae bacterium]